MFAGQIGPLGFDSCLCLLSLERERRWGRIVVGETRGDDRGGDQLLSGFQKTKEKKSGRDEREREDFYLSAELIVNSLLKDSIFRTALLVTWCCLVI